MKKAFVSLTLSFFIIGCTFTASAASEAPETDAASVIVIDAHSGKVLFERNSGDQSLIASTTKMMTALLVLENCAFDEQIDIKPEYTNIEGSSIYLRAGEKFTVEELLYGLMLASGNDAAVALACHTAGSVEAFADLMNKKADELDLTNTSFQNPHGLDEEGHYSTAEDLAKIAAAAMENDKFAQIVSTKSQAVQGRVLVNHNKLLWKYAGTLGVKTGYTMQSGRSLVSCAERDGTRFIIVTINDRNDWEDHMSLYEWAFANYKTAHIVSKDDTAFDIPVISGTNEKIIVKAADDIKLLTETEQSYETKIYIPQFVFAPVSAGDVLGRADVFVNGQIVATTDLIAANDISVDENETLTLWQKAIKNISLMLNK